jgi:transcriptional regulator with XRE-family HTH domain
MYGSLGAQIRHYRRLREMTQEELALAVGYSTKASINKIEKNQSTVPHNRLVQIAKVLDVPIGNLTGEGKYVPQRKILNRNYESTKNVNIDNDLSNDVETYKKYINLMKGNDDISKAFRQFASAIVKNFNNDDFDKSIMKKFHALTPEHQTMVTGMINGFYIEDINKNVPSTMANDEEDTGTQKGTPSLQ